MRIFLDTSLLSDRSLLNLRDEIVRHLARDDTFHESVITHFQIIWGYAIAGRSPVRYENFLRKTGMEIVPLTKSDADDAANFKPIRADLLDALIAASARRHKAIIWTADKDFLKFLPKSGVRIF